jgi:hypothetical protein
MPEFIFDRQFSMPNPYTFEMPPVKELLKKYIEPSMDVIDPFAGKSEIAKYRNDLAVSGKNSVEWLSEFVKTGIQVDVALLDPPYSPRQITEVYKSVGLKASQTDTQNARLYSECKKYLNMILKPNGLAFTFGWNSMGWGKKYNYKILEILLVYHGGAHNDTICVVERKPNDSQ